jgi:hypothetical protein
MPQLLLLRIGLDPQALTIIEDAVKKSRFWNETAMFNVSSQTLLEGGMNPVTQKIEQASVTSPWTKTPATPYDPFSALRTIEIILGLRPMTIFDASAKPMFDAFATAPSQ